MGVTTWKKTEKERETEGVCLGACVCVNVGVWVCVCVGVGECLCVCLNGFACLRWPLVSQGNVSR
jgi:hypothetical protein